MTDIATTIEPLRILKLSTCNSISGQSTLTYHIGINKSGQYLLRLTDNSGGGFFSPEWIQVKKLLDILSDNKDHIKSDHLKPLYEGKSINTPAFLMAILRAENLIKLCSKVQRRYEPTDPATFLNQLEALNASGVSIKVAEIDLGKKSMVAPKPQAKGRGSKKSLITTPQNGSSKK